MISYSQTEEKGIDAVSALERVADGRPRAERVLEVYRGDRTPNQTAPKDWFTTLEFLRETGTEFAFYSESVNPGTISTALIQALHDDSRWVVRVGFSDLDGEFFGPRKIQRREARTTFEHLQSTDPVPDLVTVEESKDRLEVFADRFGAFE